MQYTKSATGKNWCEVIWNSPWCSFLFLLLFFRTCACPRGIYDTSLLSFQNSSLLCFSDAGQMTLIRIQKKLFLMFCYWYPVKASGCQRNVLKDKFRIWSLVTVICVYLPFDFSDNFRNITSLKILLFSLEITLSKLDLISYEAEYALQLLKVLTQLWLYFLFLLS